MALGLLEREMEEKLHGMFFFFPSVLLEEQTIKIFLREEHLSPELPNTPLSAVN